MGSGKKKQTVGYRYYLGVHMALCQGPIDGISLIVVGEKEAWQGSIASGRFNIDKKNLFGGDKREGGISGDISLETGAADQTQNTYLQSQLGAEIPAFRGVCCLVLEGMYMGLNPYLKSWEVMVKRTMTKLDGSAQWRSSIADINGDMNPAHIIRECITDDSFGLGLSEDYIDSSSFDSAAETLYNENFGLSFIWQSSGSVGDFLDKVLEHIDAELYVGRSDGKYKLKLIRNDYDVEVIPHLNEENIVSISNLSRKAYGELVNYMTVKYWDRDKRDKNSVTVQDTALFAAQGATVASEKEYKGITNAALALKVAQRDLKTASSALASLEITVDRTVTSIANKGEVFKLSWDSLGIYEMVFRVVKVSLGTLDKGQIKISAVQDVFSLGNSSYSEPITTNWTDPVSEPAPATIRKAIESPYYALARELGDAEASTLEDNTGYVLVGVGSPTGDSINADLYTNPTGTGYEEFNTIEFLPYCTTTQDHYKDETTFIVNNFDMPESVKIGGWAMINDEIIRVDSVSNSSVVVGRGCLDTPPAEIHPSGSTIFFMEDFAQGDEVEYLQGETAFVKVTPRTGLGTLELSLAPVDEVQITGRAFKPYPPARLLVNGQVIQTVLAGDISLDWYHRNRLEQTSELHSTDFGNIGPEPNSTYTIEFRDDLGNVQDTQTGITPNNFIYTTSIAPPIGGNVTIAVKTVRDGLSSMYNESSFFRAGYGATYGQYYGGV